VPGTYYGSMDRYTTGMRWFDRGRYAEAIHYWKPLAEAGDCDAQYRYGTLFLLGAGVPKDTAVAVDWLARAANQGQYRAQMVMATVHARESVTMGSIVRRFVIDCRDGCGLPADAVLAHQWLLITRASLPEGRQDARREMDTRIATHAKGLAADQTAQAEQAAAAWQPWPRRCTPRELI